MDIRHLRYFVAIVEHGSFTRAAEALRVAQPALSQHVRRMEEDLGLELLWRTPRGVTPTEAGELLVAQARIIIRQFEHAMELLQREGAEPSGEVRIGLPGTVSQVLSVALIETLRKRAPRLRLSVVEAMSGFVLDWLREGKIDLGVIYREADAKWLSTAHVLSEELVLIGAPGARIEGVRRNAAVPFGRVGGLELVLPGRTHGLRQLIDEVSAREAVALDVALEIDTYWQIKALVARGLGFSILPRMAVSEEKRRGELSVWRIREPAITRDVYLATSLERPLTAAGRMAERTCREVLADLVGSGAWDAELSPALLQPRDEG